MENLMKYRVRVMITAVVSVLVPVTVLAQDNETETGEVAGYGGGAFGLGAYPLVGASAGAGFSRYAMALIDISYAPLGQQTLRRREASEVVRRSGLYDFNFSLHIRVPVAKRWAPYGIVGGGLMYDNFDLAKVTPSGTAVFHSRNENNFGFHTGAGVRYYIREGWGIRPELKVVASKRTYVCASIGIFYVLPSNWP